MYRIFWCIVFFLLYHGVASAQQQIINRKPVKILDCSSSDMCLSAKVSPNGQQILFTKKRYEGLYLLDRKSEKVEMIVAGSVGNKYFWSHDSKHIAFKSVDKKSNQKFLGVVDVDLKVINSVYGEDITLRGFDSEVEYIQNNRLQKMHTTDKYSKKQLEKNTVEDDYIIEKNDKIYRRDANGVEWLLTEDFSFNVIMSNKKDKFLYSNGVGIVIMDLFGKQIKKIAVASNAMWSQDDRFIVYEVTKDNGEMILESDIHYYDIILDKITKVNPGSSDLERMPSWSENMKIIYSSGTTGDLYELSK